MLSEVEDREEIIERVAAIDVGKAEVMCCVRVPDQAHPGRRLQEVCPYSTMTRSLLLLSDRLAELGVTRVVMEATSDYWKPVFYALERDGREVWLVNARDVRHLPGRPKTDRLDAVWLAKVAERQMLRASFVPPPEVRRLRDFTRCRADLVRSRTSEKNRVEKLFEDTCLKLSVVVSDLFGVSGRAMMAALVAGERDPKVLAQLARASLRGKIPQLEEALTGHFTDHHAFLLSLLLRRIDSINADIAAVETEIERALVPFGPAVARLDEVTGIGVCAAAVLIAEIGVDMSRFPTPGHLASWAKFAPGVSQSAGRRTGHSGTGHGDCYLASALGEIAVSAGRTDTFLGERYRRIAKRRGTNRAIVAIGRSILVIVWHLLSDPEAHYRDLGSDFYQRYRGTGRQKARYVRELQALGYRVTLEPAA